MKKLFLSSLLIFISSVLFAQSESNLHFGLKAAPSLAWLRSDSEGYDSNGSKFGFSYGLITDFNFATNYAFATGVDITYRGGKFKTVSSLKSAANSDSVISTTSTFTLQYIEIPLTLKLKTNEIGYLRYYLQIGIAPGINIRARESYDRTTVTTIGTSTVTDNDKQSGVDVQDDINNINVSMIIGGGVEYTLSGTTALLVGIQFNNGFMDVFDGDPKVNSNYLALTIAILF